GMVDQPVVVKVAPQLADENMAKQYPLRILLAEDNVVNQKVAILMLGKLGYKAEIANNGLEAVDMVKERVNSGRGAFDVVLMDVHMPELNGEEATRRIRNELPVHYQPYIIALTADALDANRERFLANGMDAYISKPIHIEDLTKGLVGFQQNVVKVETPVRVQPEESGDVLNKETIDRWMKVMGSGSIFSGIISIYLNDATSLLHDLDVAVKEKDWKRLHQAAHTLKSSSANFGATQLAGQLAQIEQIAAAMTPDMYNPDLPVMVSRTRRLYTEASQKLRELQETLAENEMDGNDEESGDASDASHGHSGVTSPLRPRD
ncbi:MAG: response regulator, partial [Anaerolineae bacterium]|nr:response regulator [Anaerolineae bacterium]